VIDVTNRELESNDKWNSKSSFDRSHDMKNLLFLSVAAAFAVVPLAITPALSQSSSGGTVIHNNSEQNETKNYTEGNPPARGSGTAASPAAQATSSETVVHANPEAGKQ
jgi:hypothetical protein